MMRNLVRIIKVVVNDPRRPQKGRLFLTRNDFMVEKSGSFFQVEYNLAAASLGSMSESVRKTHNALNLALGEQPRVPESLQNMEGFVQAVLEAHRMYGNPEATVLTVTDSTTNAVDMAHVSDQLTALGIKTRILTFEELLHAGSLNEETMTYSV